MNEQEKFWSGEFGNDYLERNSLEYVPAAISRWAKILSHAHANITDILELGCNIGINLHALHTLLPAATLAGVEINPKAAHRLRSWGKATVHECSLLHFTPEQKCDLTFTAGVLIHIAPEDLPTVYDLLYNASSRFVCICEYYNPTPAEVTYRGHAGKLFKRDFAGELMERYPELQLRGYGFFYHRDTLCKGDDVSWFLMEKT